MRILITILFLSVIFSGELEVDGNLKVTGIIENDSLAQVISNLHATITDLQTQIYYLSAQLGSTDCNGVVGGSSILCNGECIEEISECIIYDIDGNEYHPILIGNQIWLKENLKTSHYRNNIPIGQSWGQDIGAWVQNDQGDNFGYFYNGYAVTNALLCPEGFHVPSDNDWMELEYFLGISVGLADMGTYRGSDEGGKLRESGTSNWWDPNIYATDEYGFSALPGGETGGTSSVNSGGYAWFWTTSLGNNGNLILRQLSYNNGGIARKQDQIMNRGLSVRCIQD